MPSKVAPTQSPLRALQSHLVQIAVGLRAGSTDIISLTAETVSRNAVTVARQASPVLEAIILTGGPYAILAYAIHKYIWKHLKLSSVIRKLCANFYSTITIPGDNYLNRPVVEWMERQQSKRNDSNLVVSDYCVPQRTIMEKREPAFVPLSHRTEYRHDENWLRFERQNFDLDVTSNVISNIWARVPKVAEPDIIISHFDPLRRRRTKPIEQFLAEVAEQDNEYENLTIIHRLDEKAKWTRRTWKTARTLMTVAMEEKKKQSIRHDVERFLHKDSMARYVNQGNPYRRGYLFYGPPGTGKTSFCTALAGEFKLRLYVMSLSHPELNDLTLERAFEDLQPRSIIVLEDIDTAGIRREDMNSNITVNEDGKSSKGRVTYTGLLNAIDGPGGAEERILIMTTNNRDGLDSALIRCGRVDMQVLFDCASAEVTKNIFQKMYTDVGGTPIGDVPDLLALAQTFAEHVPEGRMTPAELQGFLLQHSDDPHKAIQLVDEWCRETLDRKSGEGKQK